MCTDRMCTKEMSSRHSKEEDVATFLATQMANQNYAALQNMRQFYIIMLSSNV